MTKMLNLIWLKHVIKKTHIRPKIEDFNIIGKSYRNNTFKRKYAESLLIKDMTNFKHAREICATKVFQLI